MPKIKLYNSLSNSLEAFSPIDDSNIRMYACGPTVYASPHIGNARPLVVFDVLFRLLKKMYNKVTYVRNITDVDDKINNRAKDLKISIKELTNSVANEFHENLFHLNILNVTHEPRATDHIPEMLNIIKKLIDHGFAYISSGHVLFRVKKFKQYGILSKRNLDDMIAGNRVEIAPYKEDPMDFVLWKPSEEGQPFWESNFGNGRPGWHLECSAMSHKYLGEKFDIHAGGHDLMFPHHENELAQNFGAFDCLMANYWIHNGMLLVDGQKMSKSIGNIIPLNDALRVFDGELIRYVLLSSHYQKTLNWTDQALHQAKQCMDRLYGALKLATELQESGNYIETQNTVPNDEQQMPENQTTADALCSNLNTPLALTYLHKIANYIYKSKDQKEINRLCELLKKESDVLGILTRNPDDWFKVSIEGISEEEIEKMIEERTQAKLNKNFQLADEIRQKLLAKKIKIEDTKNYTQWTKI